MGSERSSLPLGFFAHGNRRPHKVARRQGNPSYRHGDAQARERRPPASSPGGGRHQGRAFREGGHIVGSVRIVEREGTEPPLPNRPALRAGHRNFLARLRRAAASSDASLPSCERGASPPFTHSPRTRRRRTGGSPPFVWRGQLRAACPGTPVVRPAPRPAGPRDCEPLIEKKRGDGLERRPLSSSPGGARSTCPVNVSAVRRPAPAVPRR